MRPPFSMVAAIHFPGSGFLQTGLADVGPASLDDLVIASFTTGPGSTTLPIRIYSEVRLGVKPEINAICTLVVGLIAMLIVLASFAAKLSSAKGESAAPL